MSPAPFPCKPRPRVIALRHSLCRGRSGTLLSNVGLAVNVLNPRPKSKLGLFTVPSLGKAYNILEKTMNTRLDFQLRKKGCLDVDLPWFSYADFPRYYA